MTTAATLTVLITAGCATPGRVIPQIIQDQADAWNRGDVEAFMDPYWHSPDLTFSSTHGVTRGWQPVLDGYKKRYPTPAEMGRLTFSDLEVRELGRSAALVLGRWHIDRGEPIGGIFSLVWRKEKGQWMIVHDHTSVDDPPAASQKD